MVVRRRRRVSRWVERRVVRIDRRWEMGPAILMLREVAGRRMARREEEEKRDEVVELTTLRERSRLWKISAARQGY